MTRDDDWIIQVTAYATYRVEHRPGMTEDDARARAESIFRSEHWGGFGVDTHIEQHPNSSSSMKRSSPDRRTPRRDRKKPGRLPRRDDDHS